MKSTVASLVAIALCLAAPAARAVAPSPSSDLAMYLAMDTITNNVVADETGNSTGMTLPSAATASTSAPSTKFGAGSSIDFSGYGLAGGGTITTSNPKAISMSVWVHPDSIPMRVMRFVSLGNERIVLRAQEQGYLHFYMNIDGTLRHIIASGFLTTGRWQHIAGTYDGQTMRLYFDGVQVGSTTIAGNAATGSTGWWASGDGGWFDGKLDEIRVYNRVLSATDVASLAAGEDGMYCEASTPVGGLALSYITDDNSALRSAVALASAGATVRIRGTCAGTTPVVISKNLTLQGGRDASGGGFTGVSTLDGRGEDRILDITDGAVSIKNLAINNGHSEGDEPKAAGIDLGGGSLTIADSSFTDNDANDCAALGLGGGNVGITNTSFVSNFADGEGGAVCVRAGVATISGSRFESNQGSEGGAIAAYSTVFVTGTSFTQNKGFHGGAIYVEGGSTSVTAEGSTFTNNVGSPEGGAFYLSSGVVTLSGCTLSGNTASKGPTAAVQSGATLLYEYAGHIDF